MKACGCTAKHQRKRVVLTGGPGADSFWESVGTTQEREMSRYGAVIHLRTPTIGGGYNNGNPLRIESASTAAEIDERLMRIWEGHPRRFVVPASQDFLEKAARVVDILKGEMPDCCAVPERFRAGEALQSQHAAHR